MNSSQQNIRAVVPQKEIGSGFRPEIQGLRAIAIVLVLLFHLWPGRISGGFIGVDIFFVISGYLITGHLFKELHQSGSIKLGRFWSRRIRRLLPLSFTVLTASLVLMLLFMPGTTWATNVRHIVASTLYVENWALAFDAVDYLAQSDEGNMVTHYWSLSIEEQFYVFLPLLILGTILIARAVARRKEVNYRPLIISVLVAVGILSLIISIASTYVNQPQAYFITPTRMWEFVVGGLVALIGIRIHGRLGNVLGWSGVAMILIAAFIFDGDSPFPGFYALLPVIGVVLLLAGGNASRGVGVYWWASSKPAQAVGDWSYAIYLWHWPLVVLGNYTLESFLWYHKIGVLIISVVLGWASKHLIEDRVRFAPKLQGTPASLTLMGAGMAVIATVTLLIPQQLMSVQTTPTLSKDDRCYASGALINDCEPLEGDSGPYPNTASAMAENREPAFKECQAAVDDRDNPDCVIGENPDGKPNAMILGDSHATAWLPVLDQLGKDHDLNIKTFTRSGCTPIDLPTDAEGGEECEKHVAESLDYALEHSEIEYVFLAASSTRKEFSDSNGDESLENGQERLVANIEELTNAGKEVVIFEELPHFDDKVPTCLEEHDGNTEACTVSVSKVAKQNKYLTTALERVPKDVKSVSVNDHICDENQCYPVLGTVMTYRDASHLTSTFAESLYPVVEERLIAAGLFSSQE